MLGLILLLVLNIWLGSQAKCSASLNVSCPAQVHEIAIDNLADVFLYSWDFGAPV